MKETVVDRQGKKRKEEELRFLKEVQEKENKDEMKEKSEFMKQRRDQAYFREFLAMQLQEKRQSKNLQSQISKMEV